jgi:predicted peptidase
MRMCGGTTDARPPLRNGGGDKGARLMKRIAAVLLCLVWTVAPAGALPRIFTDQLQEESVRILPRTVVRYLLFLPSTYNRSDGKQWPLILYLHGSTERGNDVDMVRRNGLPAYLPQQPRFPFIVVSPQLPEQRNRWDPDMLKEFLTTVIAGLHVDRDRMYMTGWSLGATGTYETAMRFPRLFAAIAPVAGDVDARQAALLKGIPIWVFQGAEDMNVLASQSIDMVAALRDCGADVQFTLYKGCGHESWIPAYSNAMLFEWFLRHRAFHAASRGGSAE